ncbi:MAG: glycosyltransferase family 39 protein [Verrucomicrobiota bacterium]|nr:glycosyltransferase family 39 protein [Verrucomicrobiota bacterium]
MPPRPHWRQWGRSWLVQDILLPVVVTRAMLIFVAWLSLLLQPYPVNGQWEIGADGATVPVEDRPLSDSPLFVNIFARWDAGWYFSLARDGYSFVPGKQSNTAFFPIYPLLIHAVHSVWPGESNGSWMASGIVASHAALLAGVIYLFLLVRMEFDREIASRTVFYLLIFPTTLFFSAVYSEATFLAVSVAALYYARKQSWWLAGLFGGVAVLTRSQGIVLGAPLAFEYFRQRNFDIRKVRLNVLALGFVPLALVGFLLYMRAHTGNAFATRDAQFVWAGTTAGLTPQWQTFINFCRGPIAIHGGPRSLVDVIFTGIATVLTIAAAMRLPSIYGIYAAAFLLFTTAWGSFSGMSRYTLVLFPAFMILALAGKNKVFDRSYVALATGFAALFMILFAHWGWVG